MKIYKVKHIPTGKFFRGGGMNRINGNFYKVMRGEFKDQEFNRWSSEQALSICFNDNGKTWSKLHHATAAKEYKDHEPGLMKILQDCVVVEYDTELSKIKHEREKPKQPTVVDCLIEASQREERLKDAMKTIVMNTLHRDFGGDILYKSALLSTIEYAVGKETYDYWVALYE